LIDVDVDWLCSLRKEWLSITALAWHINIHDVYGLSSLRALSNGVIGMAA